MSAVELSDADRPELVVHIAEMEDQILRLKDEVGDEWARAEQAIARIAELEALSATSICIFCGETMEKDLTVMLDHAKGCGERPENRLMARIDELTEERDKWRWVAQHEWRCPLGEMNPGEPGSYIVECVVSEALLDRWQPR